ncbi:hypothetical protein EKO27_g10558 [Xylaria grammica]|uniref:Uncharacterized protein n=1 Tax=Xylaria grammica TaxID=363999 RepID=A0A439CQW3_9PEZI|nr:hypothetical protein EKO27_g10558 [Xylaria grammica]
MDRKQPASPLQDSKRQKELEFKSVLGKRFLLQKPMNSSKFLQGKRPDWMKKIALPAYREICTELGDPWEVEFSGWCLDGKQDAIEEYIEAQDDEVGEILLQRGLASACEGGRAHVARYLLQKGAKVYGRAVELACRRCDLALFEVFIEHGWHPNQQVPWARGGFGVALPHCTSDIRVVKFLLAHGADPNVGPFDFRKIHGSSITPPLDRCSGAALNKAAARGNIEVIDLLLQHGAVLEHSMPLHAALSGWPQNRPTFVHLLRLGADPNRLISYDYGTLWEMGTPLLWAVRNHNWDAVELLLEAGADPSNLTADISSVYTGIHNPDKSSAETFMALVEKVKEKKNNSPRNEP